MSTLISKDKLEPIRHRFFISKKNKTRRRLIRLGCGLTLALSDFRFVNMMRKMADDNNVSVQKIEDELDNMGFDLGPDVNIDNILNILNNAVDNSIDMYAQYKNTLDYFEDKTFRKDLVDRLVKEQYDYYLENPEMGLLLDYFSEVSHKTILYIDKEIGYEDYINNLRNIKILNKTVILTAPNTVAHADPAMPNCGRPHFPKIRP
jgi:hypothetical protein